MSPLTAKGRKVKKAMEETYKDKGGKKKAEQVFYASESAGKIRGLTKKLKKKGKK